MNISKAEFPVWNPSSLRKPVLKPAIKTLDWVKLVKGPLPKVAQDSRKILKGVCDGLGWFALPSKGSKLLRSCISVISGTSVAEKAEGTVEAFKHCTSIIQVGTNTTEIMQEAGFFSFTARQIFFLNVFGLICSIALILKSSLGVKNSIYKLIQSEDNDSNFNSNLFDLANRSCRLAIGLLGVGLFILGAEIVTPYLLLSISSLAIVTAFAKKYFMT